MNDQTDLQLLRAYAEHRTEPAFAELVRRHVDFVHSAALRMVCDSHLAQDVTQGVFVALAKNVARLVDRPVLSGWLHRTAQNIAAQTVRTDVRRRVREQEAAAMNELLSAQPEAVWKQIAPHLDAALGELSEPDRDALLLRYFERKSASEMAQTLGISDEAAQKRVSRAVERLREFFSKRNLTIGASGLVVAISANAVQAAPVGLAASISAAAILAGTAVSTSTVIAATKTIAMTTFQKALVTVALTAAVGTGIFEAHQAAQLRDQVQTLQQQQAPLAEQFQQLQNERDDATNRLGAWLADNDSNRLWKEHLELLSLRGRMTQMASRLHELEAASLVADVNTNHQVDGTESDSIILTATAATNYVSSGNSLIVGGWPLADRRSYLLIKPVIVPGNPASGGHQITIQGQVIQAPDSFWDEIGWGSYKSSAHRSTVAGELTDYQVGLLLQALKVTRGVEISTTPPTTVTDGKRSGYGFSKQEDDGTGGALMGIDFYPRISADGRTVGIELVSIPTPASLSIHPALKSN